MISKISIFDASFRLRLDTSTSSLFSDDVSGNLASSILDRIKSEEGYFGIVGTEQFTGTDILSDPWSFFLWLERYGFDPEWVSAPPKVPKAPKGAII